MSKSFKTAFVRIAGWVVTLVGIVLWILPIPLGIPVTAFGLVLLITSSRSSRRMLRWMRLRFRLVDWGFSLLETYVPARTRAILRKTRFRKVGRRGGNGFTGSNPDAPHGGAL